MRHPFLTAVAVTTALAAPAPAFAQGAPPAPGCFGMQATDKAGDNQSQTGGQQGSPSSDLIGGWISHDGGKMFANIQVETLTEGEIDPPFVAIGWEFMMTTSAGDRFVRAYQDRTGIVKWTWGEPRALTDDQTQPRAGGTTTGTLFPGKGGVIQIELPVEAEFGAKPGTQLKGFGLEVRQWVSLPAAVPNTGLPLFSPAPIFDEAAGKGAVTVGPCPAAPAPGAPSGPPAPGPGPDAPGPGPGGTPQQGSFDVKVRVPRLSARKLAKRRKFTVRLTGQATELVAAVRKKVSGGKNLATGKLATLNGKGKLKLKAKRKLRKGTYVLVFSGKNAQGQPAEGAVKFKVRR